MSAASRRGRGGRVTALRTVLAVAAALTLAGAPTLAAAEDKVAFTITDEAVTESSGLATDLPNQRYWTVNDSGDSGVAYALNADGEALGTVRFAAPVQDVEALALRNNRIYLADIGDNGGSREFVTVYAIADPDPGEGQRGYQAYDFSYPDGPHDAEGFFLDGTGRMYVVTKEASGGIYRAPVDPSRSTVNELERVGDAPAFATDATYLGDGAVAIRTYVSVEVVDLETYRTRASVAAPLQPQGESITLSLDGDDLLLGSEGEDSDVYAVPVPTAVEGNVPSGSASPPPTTTSTPSGGGTATSTTAPADGGSTETAAPPLDSGGTMLALALAGVVAVVAAVVVIVVRRP